MRDYGVDGQIGLESTIEAYIEKLVAVFRLVRRVLQKDGTCWINLGDSYGAQQGKGYPGYGGRNVPADPGVKLPTGLPAKNLCGIPWRAALALQADGWYLRSAMPWVKRNPMPESCRDRPTSALEYVFLLTPSPRYFFDMEAVRQKHARLWNPDTLGGNLSSGSHKLQGRFVEQERATPAPNPAGRAFRNTDLFYASLREPHGLIAIGDELVALDVVTEPLRSVDVCGSYHIVSRDCPVHDYPAYLLYVRQCGELLAVSDVDRNLRNDVRRVLERALAEHATPEDHRAFLSDETSASDHSNGIRKTGTASKQDGTCGDKSASHTEYKGLVAHSAATFARIHGNNTGADGVSGAIALDLSGQMIVHNDGIGILSWHKPPSGCRCKYIGKVARCQDHFAAFPRRLVEPMIKAGTSEKGCCPECGAPWVRVLDTDRRPTRPGARSKIGAQPIVDRVHHADRVGNRDPQRHVTETRTVGWKPGCGCMGTCQHAAVPDVWKVSPCTVLDPFAGSGTVGVVAKQLGRHFIGIELSREYAAMAERRIANPEPLPPIEDDPKQQEFAFTQAPGET